jgi:hypothetical protein
MVNNKGDEIRYIIHCVKIGWHQVYSVTIISNLVSMLANKPILSSIPRI